MGRRGRLGVVAVGVVLLAGCGERAANSSSGAPEPTARSTSAPSPTTEPPTPPAPSPPSSSPPPSAGAPTTSSPPATSPCTGVAHFGDSTSVGMVSTSYLPDPAQRLAAQYARVGAAEQHLEIDGARSIVETHHGSPNARDTARAVRAGGYQGCWVFAMGTTDAANVGAGSNFSLPDRIDRMMEVAGSDPVLWVTVKTLVPSGAWSNPNMQQWNAALEDATSRYPNMRIYDWASVVQDRWFEADGIHYTSQGYAERARLIADALVLLAVD